MEISMEQPLLGEMLVLFYEISLGEMVIFVGDCGFHEGSGGVHGPFYGQYNRIADMYQSVRAIMRSGSSHKSYIATDLGYVVSAYFVDCLFCFKL